MKANAAVTLVGIGDDGAPGSRHERSTLSRVPRCSLAASAILDFSRSSKASG
jgi:hypothetical protein